MFESTRPRYIPVKCYPCNSVFFAVYVLQEYDLDRSMMILQNLRSHRITPNCTAIDPTAKCDYYHHFFLPYQPSKSALSQHMREADIVQETKMEHLELKKFPLDLNDLWEDIRVAWFKNMYSPVRESKEKKRKLDDDSESETLSMDDCIHFKLLTTPS